MRHLRYQVGVNRLMLHRLCNTKQLISDSVYPHSSASLHNSSPWPGSYPSPYDWPHAPSAPPRLQVPDGFPGQSVYSSHPSAHAQQTPVLTPRSSINFATSVNHLFNKFKSERQLPQWPWIQNMIFIITMSINLYKC